MASPRVRRAEPHVGQLWLSRPPYLFTARILDVVDGDPPAVAYDLFDWDGSRLLGPLGDVLDHEWWSTFQPLVRREG